MARYFLDTGVLVGLSFLHDLWSDEAERLFANDNSLYISRTVIYEYCNSTANNSPESADVDWETEEGVFGDKLSKVRVAQMNLDLKYRGVDDEELTLDTLVDDFVSETGIDREVFPKELIEERIRPNIRAFLKDEIDNREITCEVARETMDALCDTIQTQARDARETILERVTEYPESDLNQEKFFSVLGFVDGYGDKLILSTVANLNEKNVLKKIVSADKSHMYGNRDRLKAVLGIHVVFVKDEFASPSLPTD